MNKTVQSLPSGTFRSPPFINASPLSAIAGVFQAFDSMAQRAASRSSEGTS